MSKTKDLFNEKFRPKELNQLIVPNRIREELTHGLIQNLLLAGPPGTGKTSLAYIMAKDHQTYYINASADARIDIIEKIKDFCSTVSLGGEKNKLKVVILDEVDGASDAFFKALRPTIERYHKTTRFILTCNYIHKIPDPILSRMNTLDICPNTKEEEEFVFKCYVKRVAAILKAVNISYDETSVVAFVKSAKGDLRTIMNRLQSLYNRDIKTLSSETMQSSYSYKELYDLCITNNDGKYYENYKFITAEYANKIDECMASLGTDFLEYLQTISKGTTKYDAKMPQVLICVAEYQHILSQGPTDPMITLLACIAKLQIILNS